MAATLTLALSTATVRLPCQWFAHQDAFMRSAMPMVFYALSALAGAATVVLVGVAIRYVEVSDGMHTFNIPVICLLAAATVSPLVFLVVLRIAGRRHL